MNEHIRLLRRSKVSWLYPIYIPSHKRAGSAPLLNMLWDAPWSVQVKVHIVVRPEEVVAYTQAYPWAEIVEEATPGIGPARMACLRDAEERGYEKIVVLDDDIWHVSLLEAVEKDNGKTHARRYSARVSGIEEPTLLLRSLAVACRMADEVFTIYPEASYGAARNALFSGDTDVSVGVTLTSGSFPACVMFFDVDRFQMRDMPKPYQYHGEDLAMFLDTMERGQLTFTLPGVAYDQQGTIETTIPLDVTDEVGRPHLETTEEFYPDMHQYLRVSMRNPLGGVMRIGVNWSRFYKATGRVPVKYPLTELIKEI
jgi:hypothetical protein